MDFDGFTIKNPRVKILMKLDIDLAISYLEEEKLIEVPHKMI